MQFTIKRRDGPARIGELLLDEGKSITPTIGFIDSTRCKAPDFADLIITKNQLKSKKPTIQVGNSIFSDSSIKKNEESNEVSIESYLLYPKDLPKQMHLKSIQYNIPQNAEYCIIPAKEEVLDDFIVDNDASLVIVSDSAQLFFQQSKFVSFMTSLREKIGYRRLLYLPSIGTPSSVSLLTYLGVDVFDSTAALLSARNDILLFPDAQYHKTDLSELHCSCPSCTKITSKPSEMSFSEIVQHNYYMMDNEIKHVRNAIIMGRLRELVERRVSASPSLAAIVSILDQNYTLFLEERTPTVRKNQLLSTTMHSLHRPEVKRFQSRVLNRYVKPKSAKLLLLLPCSAKKPYSFSKSHKRFREAIFYATKSERVHEVILTSPLGIVPRELELLYPASRYDIAVSGYWNEEEKTMIRTLLQRYLTTWKYEKIIVHVPESIQDFIVDLFKNPIITCKDSPTSTDSLEELSTVLGKELHEYEPIKSAQRTHENILALASYQFGTKIAEHLLKNSIIRGKYPYQKILQDNKQLGMITKDRGMISLTTDGAQHLLDFDRYWVEIHDDFSLIGSVFAPGIKDADEQIRIGDEVVVTRKKTLCGVGVAQMNGKQMKQLTHGEAVKIRHRC